MLVKPRAYPHPVLSHFGDDIVGSLFQATVVVKGTQTSYQFDIAAKTSNADLKALLKDGQAQIAIHVECASTRYRSVFLSSDEKFSFQIPSADIDGRVEICSFIVAANDIVSYSNKGFHPDYQGLSFPVRRGDTLAVAPDASFLADKRIDPLRRIPSIFVVVPDERPQAPAMDIDTTGHKVRVSLAPANFAAYSFLKDAQGLHTTLNTLIVIPALIAVLEQVKRAAASEGLASLESRRWYMTLARKLRELGVQPEVSDSFGDSTPTLAQRLVGEPLTDSLRSLKGYEQDDEVQ